MTIHRHSPAKREKLRKRRTLRHRIEVLEARLNALETREPEPQLIILTEGAAEELLKRHDSEIHVAFTEDRVDFDLRWPT